MNKNEIAIKITQDIDNDLARFGIWGTWNKNGRKKFRRAWKAMILKRLEDLAKDGTRRFRHASTGEFKASDGYFGDTEYGPYHIEIYADGTSKFVHKNGKTFRGDLTIANCLAYVKMGVWVEF